MVRALLPLALLVVVLVPARASAQECTCPPEADKAVPPPAHDQLKLTKVAFKDLPGWADDKPRRCRRSCARARSSPS
jgi:hypothetical protein